MNKIKFFLASVFLMLALFMSVFADGETGIGNYTGGETGIGNYTSQSTASTNPLQTILNTVTSYFK